MRPRAFPNQTRGVVAGALDFKDPRAEVPDGVAAEQHGGAGALAERAVETENDLALVSDWSAKCQPGSVSSAPISKPHLAKTS